MIPIKSTREIERMRRAGAVTGKVLAAVSAACLPGVSTQELDAIACKVLAEHGAVSPFLGYNGFTGSICVSVNEEVIHGIPGRRKLRDGDIVSVDAGACLDGYIGDSAATFAVGRISPEAARLIEVTRTCFYEALAFMREGCRIGDISHAIQKHAEQNGFQPVRRFTGHGVGAALHEDPEVPGFGEPGRGARLQRGMTLAVEPMINQGTYAVDILKDGWTVVTSDKKLSAHYEHTVLITDGQPEILTAREGDLP